MSRLVVLDTGPLGLLARNPLGREPMVARCVAWADDLAAQGTILAIPEIARYELRRELRRLGLEASLARLDGLCRSFAFLPIADGVMDRASDLWADVRKAGRPTAPKDALDGDAILAAQALVAAESGRWRRVVIATTNAGHLIRFPDIVAKFWDEIVPASP